MRHVCGERWMDRSKKIFLYINGVLCRSALFCGGFALSSLVACSTGNAPDTNASKLCGGEPAEVSAQRQDNFGSTLHRLLLQQSCTDCHNGKSGKAPYAHSSSDLNEAYSSAVQLVDLLNPQNSRIVVKTLTNHNCGNAGQCRTLADAEIKAISDWETGEHALPPPPDCNVDLKTGLSLALVGKSIKYSDLSKTVPTVLRWNLADIKPELGQMWLSVNIKAFTAPSGSGPGSYTVDNVVFATAQQRVEVVGIVPVINGVLAPKYADLAGLNFVVGQRSFDPTASILGFAPISDNPMQIAFVNATAGDTLGWSILIRSSDATPSTSTKVPACRATAEFKLVYDNVFDLKVLTGGVYKGQCTQCHGDKTQAANAVMDFAGDACREALARVNLTLPYKSLLLEKPSHADTTGCQLAGQEHPVTFRFVATCQGVAADAALNAQRSLLLNWITKEAQLQ